ncbi:hypothetical protein BH10ACI2_BH10ACI2_22610 [soil metagenome]
MDGNFGGTLEMRLQVCDTVIFLDMPRWLCLYRILKRTVLHHNAKRPDMAEGCLEKFDLEFIFWVWNFQNSGKKRLLAELAGFPDKQIIILRSSSEAESLIQDLLSI